MMSLHIMHGFFKWKYLLVLFLTGIGVFAGILIGQSNTDKIAQTASIRPIRESNKEYNFISPLLFYQVPSDLSEYEPLASKIRKLIADSGGGIINNIQASVYYRDLDSGHWFGINENEKYVPASLLKVVVMIAYYKRAEVDPSVLTNTIIFTKDIQDLIGKIPYDQGTELKLDGKYIVNDLIDMMITKSDNGATYALMTNFDGNVLAQVFKSLGLQNPDKEGRNYMISAQDYASFFRILYNATYLDRTMSEKALALLSKTTFNDGIAAGVSKTTQISHKYGEAISVDPEDNTSTIELHDCGIVYSPNNPYLLCVMTRGSGPIKTDILNNITGLIKSISQIIYYDAH